MGALVLLGIYLLVSSAAAGLLPVTDDSPQETLLRRIDALETNHAEDLARLNKKLLEAEKKVEELKETAAALAEQCKVKAEVKENDKRPSKRDLMNGGQIAFTAYLNHDQDQIGTNQAIVFNKMLMNDGGGYSNHTGAFTAPLDGVYYFSFFIAERGDQQFIAALTHNSRNVVDAVAETVEKQDDAQGGNAATLQLYQGDVVMVKHLGATHGDHLEGSRALRSTTFSGFLIYSTQQVSPVIG